MKGQIVHENECESNFASRAFGTKSKVAIKNKINVKCEMQKEQNKHTHIHSNRKNEKQKQKKHKNCMKYAKSERKAKIKSGNLRGESRRDAYTIER